MKNKFVKLITISLAVMLTFSGCTTPNEDIAPIKVSISDDIKSLDVAGTKDILSETVGRCVFSTLYIFDETLNLIPCLAKEQKQIADNEWQFTIRDDAKFHDGSKITASDVAFSIKRAMTGDAADKSLLVIESINVLDDTNISFITKETMANFPSLLVRTSTSVMSEKAVSDPSYDFDKPVGSGAFKVIEWVKGKEIRLERFDEYFNTVAKSPFLSFIIQTSEPNSTASLLNGTVDVLYRVPASEGDYLKLNDSLNLYQVDSTKTEILIINPRLPILDNLLVRQAIACAIDKQNIVDNVLSGYARVQSSMIPAPLIGFADFNEYSYDPKRAKELLVEAGYPDGFSFSILVNDSQRKKLMEYIKLDLAKINIELDYELLGLTDYLDRIEQGEGMGSVMSWTSNADPDSTFTQLYSKAGHPTVNQTGFTNERVEELLVEGRIQTDIKKRDQIYKEINNIVAKHYVAIPLYQPAVIVAARNEIEGIQINPQGLFGYESIYRQMKN